MKIQLTNNLHNTSVGIIPHKDKDGDYYLSSSQIKRAKKALCGMRDCACQNIQEISRGMNEIQNPSQFLFALATHTKHDTREYL